MPAGTRQGVKKVGGVGRLGLCQSEEQEMDPKEPQFLSSRQ